MKSHSSPLARFSDCRLAVILSSLVWVLLLNHHKALGSALEFNPSLSSPEIQSNSPVAQVGFHIFAGNGNHAIDPNECNALNIVLTNGSGVAISGINASLVTSDPDVIITQPLTTYPDFLGTGLYTNNFPFQISTLQSFTAGRTISANLIIASSSSGLFSIPVTLTTGEISATGTRVNNNSVTAIPDVGVKESTNVVAGFTGVLAKAVVSLYLTHPSDQDLTNISLIGPDGTTVLLSAANGGTGQNYGSGTNDASRTVFDDFATNLITHGTAPFVGTFKPQMPLSVFYGKTNANGNWRLHIADGRSGSVGTLQAWSLFLYPVTNIDGGGACELCPANVFLTNTLSASSGVISQRLFRDSNPSACDSTKPFPGTINGTYSYQAYPFYNGTSNTCINVTLVAATADVMSAAFVGTFDPNNPQITWLADSGNSTAGATTISYSFNVNPDTVFIVEVNNVTTNGTYNLAVSGGDCAPRLNISSAGTNKVDVIWPAVSGDFKLETSPQITPMIWSTITNEPVASAGRFNATNRSDLTPLRIYRLHGY